MNALFKGAQLSDRMLEALEKNHRGRKPSCLSLDFFQPCVTVKAVSRPENINMGPYGKTPLVPLF